MNLSIEYIMRSGIAKSFLDTPCSLFYFKKGKKVVVTIEESSAEYKIKHWNIFDCEASCALPPMEEYCTNNPFEDSKVVLSDYKLLEFNSFRQPKFWGFNHPNIKDSEFSAEKHNKIKELWLWNSFMKIYNMTLFVLFQAAAIYGRSKACVAMQNQQVILQENEPKTWKYWNGWKKYMLNSNSTPGELVFGKVGNE